MTILSSEVKFYNPQVRDDSASNGGRMTASENVDNVANNVWPHVDEAERTAGSDKYRKLFTKLNNANDEPLYDVRQYLAKPTPGDDLLFLFAGTQTDTQGDLTGSENLYGAGTLDTSLSGGESSIDVLVEDWANYPIFRDGDEIVIWKGADSEDPDAYEFLTLSGAPSAVGNVVTLTLAGTVGGAYTAGSAWVASTLSRGTVQAMLGTVAVTSGAGTLDDAQIVPHNLGAVEDTITLTFTSSTAFDAVGAVLGSLGSGSVLSNWEPTNPNTGTGYLLIPSAAWGGTFVAGDTVSIPLHPAALPHWERRVVPAGAAVIAAFTRDLILYSATA